MTRPTTALPALSAAVAALVAFPASPAPVPKERPKPDPYFPTVVGDRWVHQVDRWVYRAEGGKKELLGRVTEQSEGVTAVEEKDGVTLVTVGSDVGGKLVPGAKLAVSEAGVHYVVRGQEDPFWKLKLPAKPGSDWSYHPDPGNRDVFQTMTVRGEEEVEVPAGRYKAIRVEQRAADRGPDPVVTWWYARRVGMVRMEGGPGTGQQVWVLKSFTEGKGKNPAK